jgi:CRP/FNR family transcriptional regulator, anaerobic regulatory protein
MTNKLLEIIGRQVKLTSEDITLVNELFEPVWFRKNRVIEEEGKVPQYLYFIVSGYLRLFHYDEDGNEVTSHLNCPPGFITPYQSFIAQLPANESLESITSAELLRIDKNNLDYLTRVSEAVKNFSIWVFQQAMAYNENRSRDLATLTAEQRYTKFMELHKDVLMNVPLQYIASFLGMNAKSLSRIRKQAIR